MSAFAWSAIDWVSLVALSILVLVAARIGQSLSFDNRGVGALITALLFAVGFAAWSYSLHDSIRQGLAMVMPGTPG
jgi:xanthine/uracil permease